MTFRDKSLIQFLKWLPPYILTLIITCSVRKQDDLEFSLTPPPSLFNPFDLLQFPICVSSSPPSFIPKLYQHNNNSNDYNNNSKKSSPRMNAVSQFTTIFHKVVHSVCYCTKFIIFSQVTKTCDRKE